MKLRSARRPWIWLACAVIAVATVVALLVAGSQSRSVRAFALDAPNQFPLLTLRPPMEVCEGPITTGEPARAVAIWGSSPGNSSTMTVNVLPAHGRQPLASGALTLGHPEGEYFGQLARLVPAGRPVRVCLRQTSGAFTLVGSPAVVRGVVMTGPVPGKEFSLVLLAPGGQSTLGALPTAFSRAALWRPSWVGSWTFWVLAAGLLATFALGVMAVMAAASDDDRDDRPNHEDSDEEDGPPAPRPSSSDPERKAAYS